MIDCLTIGIGLFSIIVSTYSMILNVRTSKGTRRSMWW